MNETRFISAIATPLDEQEGLHVDGLEKHLDDQWTSGIHGVLVAGSMGAMQLLRKGTYQQLIEEGVRFSKDRGEVLVGVGDTSLVRTRDRIELVNRYSVDGVVVITPFFLRFAQEELVDYFRSLADTARSPLYLYHLPALTGAPLEPETVARVAEHPNIAGIKCSCDIEWTRQLAQLVSDDFRIIVAQPQQVATLVQDGFREHLDGIFALAPKWTVEIGRAAEQRDNSKASEFQGKLNRLLDLVRSTNVMPAFTVLLNARGIPGNYAPAPLRPLSETDLRTIMDDPVVEALLEGT